MRRFIVIAYFFKERSAGAIPPCGEFRAIVGVDAYRRDIDAVLHNVIKEPFKEYCGGRGRISPCTSLSILLLWCNHGRVSGTAGIILRVCAHFSSEMSGNYLISICNWIANVKKRRYMAHISLFCFLVWRPGERSCRLRHLMSVGTL